MHPSGRLQSLFSQKLDRAVFGTYFLGAVVPMLALAFVTHRFALPSLDQDSNATAGMIGFIVGVGVLSLAAFFALRRLTHAALARMDADNERLAAILEASRELSGALHGHAVAQTAAGCGLALTGGAACVLLVQPAPDKSLELCESAGQASLYDANEDTLAELVASATSTGNRAVLETSDGEAGLRAAAAIPLSLSKGLPGAFVVMLAEPGARFAPEALDAVATLASLTSVAWRNAELQDAQRNFFSHVTDILVAALDAQLDRGDPRRGHSSRIAALANSLGRELELDEEGLQRLHFAALLHDIGLLKIDRALHGRPEQCRNHPVLGHRLLARIRMWEDVAPIVLHHHEWWDGSGYPESRAGEAIPLESRIISLADAFDKWTHEDYERPALPAPVALERVAEARGSRFDPRVVDAFTAIVERGDLVA